MSVYELNKDQMEELKQSYLSDLLCRKENRTPYYGELAAADEMVSNEAIFNAYSGVEFSSDDFFCSAGKED